MNDWWLMSSPLLFLAAALAIAMAPRKVPLWWITTLTPLISGCLAWQHLTPTAMLSMDLMDYSLMPVRADALGLLMVGLFHVAAFIGALFISPIKDRLQHGALLSYFAGGLGVALAGDWISFFIFFEIIALSGAALVFVRRDEAATQAGVRYLLFQIAAGVTVLAGFLLHAQASGDWSVGPVALNGLAGWLLLIGFGIKAGFPLMHIWLVDAYPKASMAGLAVLVAVTTKVAILALIRVFPGEGALVAIGTVMALWPIAYVLAENNLRRVLAYSMMVQLGLMVVAIGVGTPTALDGVALHVVMDVLFKMILFMAVALLWVHRQTTQADQLSGMAKHWPIVAGCVAVAALANIALPLTGGFISKKLMLYAIEHADLPSMLYWILVSLSVLGLLYAWVRIAWRVFFAPATNTTQSVPRVAGIQQLALLIPAVLLLVAGMAPGLLDGLRPFESTTEVWTSKTISAQLALLGGGGLVYFIVARLGWGLPKHGEARLYDVEVIYRWVLVRLPEGIRTIGASVLELIKTPLQWVGQSLVHPASPLRRLGQSWPIGAMAFWVAILFAVLLVMGLFGA